MRVTLIIFNVETNDEYARIQFPNKEIFMQVNWLINYPCEYRVEWDEDLTPPDLSESLE